MRAPLSFRNRICGGVALLMGLAGLAAAADSNAPAAFTSTNAPPWFAGTNPPAGAATTNPPARYADELENLSLEQLVNVQVTSVSKKETDEFASAAAIYVITQEDIRRSGATSLPDALRMVPGMDVGQINASQWAVSARGFNGQYADNLLVLVDGRSVYSPIFGGIIWELQDLVMEDVDRIEVIRGPGAALWGDNAVNGVVNITTKSARETQGALVSTSFGTDDQTITSARYGGQFGTNLFYRVFVKYSAEDGFNNTAPGGRPYDGYGEWYGGSRLDWEPNPNDRFTAEGSYLAANFGGTAQVPRFTPPYATNVFDVDPKSDGNALGRWTHDFSASSQLALQMFYDHSVETEVSLKSAVDVYDVDLQDRFELGQRQDIVWGGGYRDIKAVSPPTFDITLLPERSFTKVYNLFGQDDVTVVDDRVHLILGTKLSHNSYTGFEIQPSGRLLWTPSEKQTVWLAVSRAVSTPSQAEEGLIYNQSVVPTPNGPALVSVQNNQSVRSEKLLSYELGYRLVPAPSWSLDLATYYNIYSDIVGYAPGTPYFVSTPVPHLVLPEIIGDDLRGDTYGAELSAQWKPLDYWRFVASYSWLHMQLEPVDTGAGSSPQYQFQIHSYLDLPHNVDVDAAVYYVSDLPYQNVPAYVRCDVGVNWRLNKSWEFGVFAQNLFDHEHVEFDNYRSPVLTEIPFSINGRIIFRF